MIERAITFIDDTIDDMDVVLDLPDAIRSQTLVIIWAGDIHNSLRLSFILIKEAKLFLLVLVLNPFRNFAFL